MESKIFIGPMTKNVVDSVIDFCNETNSIIGLIPSRRQIEYNGGYVNNWRTDEFSKYVKSKSNNIILQRDHGGPGQGNDIDTGLTSLIDDCKYLDLIHIDPWKQYSEFAAGVEYTANLIKFCYSLNPNVYFEIGTEEAIRRFDFSELNELVHNLKILLTPKEYNQIKYLVIQSGTSLKETTQTGTYDSNRLKDMISICKYHNLLSKEHNGDYIPVDIIKQKFNLGLDAINIAPEFGLIETQTYLDNIQDEETLFEFWNICYKSNKWVKWVNKDFDPVKDKISLIKICGHYVLSYPEFLGIKKKFPYINSEIKNRVIGKLNELYGY
jgi:fructose/tagatose bisphosphate aldolase